MEYYINYWYNQWKYWVKFSIPQDIKTEIYKEGLIHPSIVPTDKIKNFNKTIYN